MKTNILQALLICLLSFPAFVVAQKNPKPPSPQTIIKNKEVLNQLPFSDTMSFVNARRGFIATTPDLNITRPDGMPVWNMAQYNFMNTPTAPYTVNPSLWRQERLNNMYGLFKVVDGIYQVRGYDMSNMTIIEGNTGLILVDPLVSEETARAALKLYHDNVDSKREVRAIINTHSHVDHYGGIFGVTTRSNIESGKVLLYVPQNFLEEAVSENVYAGNAMSRRAQYMYGIFLKKDSKGQVGVGLGKGSSTGNVGIMDAANDSTIIKNTGEVHKIDGLDFVFQMAPHTEAPAEMLFYIPKYKALCSAEDATHVLHNLYTLRGAQVRSSQSWWQAVNETINLFGDSLQVVFASHHWPTWGNQASNRFLKNQRDLYKYLHDQVLNLANKGYTMIEIGEMMKLPKSLDQEWYNRGYYGSVNHDSKAVYQYYLGFYTGNPADLYQLTPRDAAIKFVEYMGGPAAVIEKAKKDFVKGHYRWVAQVMNQVVYADSSNMQARYLEADALEQLGYQTENATWRNNFLMGAYELRNGVNKKLKSSTVSPATIAGMTVDMLFDLMGIQLNATKADGKNYTFNYVVDDQNPETPDNYILYLTNSVLIYEDNKQAKSPDATITMKRTTWNDILVGKTTFVKEIDNGNVKISNGSAGVAKFLDLLNMQETFDLMFNIVTPR
ncbi:MAG: alkyl/aryl-sulfatase [Spirosomataceae bacterium]